MRNIKLMIAFVFIVLTLTAGKPAIAKADTSLSGIPLPAIVLVQDKNNKMLLKHSFEGDNGMMIPWDLAGIDSGINAPAQ